MFLLNVLHIFINHSLFIYLKIRIQKAYQRTYRIILSGRFWIVQDKNGLFGTMIKTTLYIKNITIRQIKNVFPFRESSLSLDFLRLWWTPQDKYEYFCAAYFKHNHANIYFLDYHMQSITKRSDKAWNVTSLCTRLCFMRNETRNTNISDK